MEIGGSGGGRERGEEKERECLRAQPLETFRLNAWPLDLKLLLPTFSCPPFSRYAQKKSRKDHCLSRHVMWFSLSPHDLSSSSSVSSITHRFVKHEAWNKKTWGNRGALARSGPVHQMSLFIKITQSNSADAWKREGFRAHFARESANRNFFVQP